MIITVLKELEKNEHRVAVTPENVKRFKEMGFSVEVQEDAGKNSGFTNESYKESGATISKTPSFTKTSILLCVNMPDKKSFSLFQRIVSL